MDFSNLHSISFLGIGGIGMSALARFFNERGVAVTGYDRVETPLTRQLTAEGMQIHYEDNVQFVNKAAELVVYTPAIPANNQELSWYREQGYQVSKRSDVLQWITQGMYAITVAGTHGKTTTATMIAHILRDTGYGCNAFLGGISANYDKNYWRSDRQLAVIEADEYDRSFLKLAPDLAVLTSMDADHLDIYGTPEAMVEAFIQYTANIKAGGTLLYKHGLRQGKELKADHKVTYSLQNDAAEVYASQVQIKDGGYRFDVHGKGWMVQGLELGMGGSHNVENCVVAVAVAKILDIEEQLIRKAVASFKGVKRRFEYIVKQASMVYIDDYAHHPEELAALIKSAKILFPDRRCVVVFQPHLYSRTRDLADGFARSLDLADEVLLLPIYPAREAPIDGVSVQMIADKMGNPNHTILIKEGLLRYVAAAPLDLLITSGAGDIDKLVPEIKTIITNK